MNRSRRASMAQETLQILEQGSYLNPAGKRVVISADLNAAIQRTRFYKEADWADSWSESARNPGTEQKNAVTTITVQNMTTLAAARELLEQSDQAVLGLNFASAKNPGGGFLGGSQAQEESLARSSGLYACLTAVPEMYSIGRSCGSCFYTHSLVYSPAVPVFRSDDGTLLNDFHNVSFITAAAVNAGCVQKQEPQNAGRITEVMRERSRRVLQLAAQLGYQRLVLGAWGCGVFQNDPATIAQLFDDHLQGAFAGVFQQVLFAVLDKSDNGPMISPFRQRFER
ncbi:MAG: TIGR02452 family protein [Leptospiraceae bacterium]|nr:TIGR02452 family protein [Leptospiraceae bacterium]